MTDIYARMLAKPAFVVTPIKKNGIRDKLDALLNRLFNDNIEYLTGWSWILGVSVRNLEIWY